MLELHKGQFCWIIAFAVPCPLSSNASFCVSVCVWKCVCVWGGGGGLDRKRHYSTTLSHLLIFVQTRVCLAYLFRKTLRLSIINVKPIAIIKNHKINETMCGQCEDNVWKSCKWTLHNEPGEKKTLSRILSKEEPFKNLRMTRKLYILLSVPKFPNHILFCRTHFPSKIWTALLNCNILLGWSVLSYRGVSRNGLVTTIFCKNHCFCIFWCILYLHKSCKSLHPGVLKLTTKNQYLSYACKWKPWVCSARNCCILSYNPFALSLLHLLMKCSCCNRCNSSYNSIGLTGCLIVGL